jgi:fucose 4-O-acetylase-like acetyltransferase
MSKWQSKDLPTAFTSLGILLIAFADKIEEWTSIPYHFIYGGICIIFLIPLYIWISGWLKNRK